MKKRQPKKQVEKKDDFKLTFNLSGINILKFHYDSAKGITLPLPLYKIQLIIKHGLDSVKKVAMVFVTVIIKNEEETIVLGSIEVSYTFNIINFDEVIKVENENAIMDNRVLHTLNSVAVSTTRGIAFAKFQDTALYNAIMPVYDLSKLMPLESPSIPNIPT